MDVSTGPIHERIARVLAGQRASLNADGSAAHAADIVDRSWPEFRDQALAVLKTLREPDQTMAAAGDPAVWERMVLAAIGEAES